VPPVDILEELQREPDRSTPVLRAVRRKYSKSFALVPAASVFQAAGRILDTRDPSLRFVAYELVHHHPAARASLRKTRVERLGRGMTSWGEVDAFGYYISGPAWCDGGITDAAILAWTVSADRWWRRAALVSTIAMTRRGDKASLNRSVRVCTRLVRDRDDMIVKALSWALREIARRDAARARRFLKDHRAGLAPRVTREVTNKIVTGRKNPVKAVAKNG
jgi:3-methyladenine DNA glycosylase AlkD